MKTKIDKDGKIVRSEYTEQCQVVDWLSRQYPNALFSCSMAGIRVPIGTAKKMKAMGNRPGMPDIMIFEPKDISFVGYARHYNGLFVELKRESGGVVSPIQTEVLAQLNQRGYKAVVANGYDEAVKVISDYLGKAG